MGQEKQVKRENGSTEKNKHTGAKAGAAAVVVLALLGGGYFGLGGGGQGGLFPNGQGSQGTSAPETVIVSVSEEETETQSVETTPENDQVLKIVVTESGIQYEGRDVNVTELEEALLKDFQEGLTVTVKDDHAIKATYDEVTALLSKLNISFTEEE